ncbi:MAG: hypothetical protein KKC46_22090 [Proteobacteria bacterium]|nr:hypothetical protein [Pseudomonadota bacterium]
MGNWLEKIEKSKESKANAASHRSDKWSKQWNNKYDDSNATYESKKDKICLKYGNIRSIASRLKDATVDNSVPIKVSGFSLKLGHFPTMWKSERGSSGITSGGVRRITIEPCRGDSFRVSTWHENALFTEQNSYIKIDNVSEDVIVSWLKWIVTGKGWIRPMDKLKLAVVTSIGLLIIWLIIK